MNEKALESFIDVCDEMMVPVQEGLLNRTKIRLTKVKLKDGEGKWDGAVTGIKYQGASVEISKKIADLDNPEQKSLITSSIKKILSIVDKVYKSEYEKLVENLLLSAPEWEMNNVKTKSDLIKLMKLDLITIDYSFKSRKEGNSKFPLSDSMDKDTYIKENKERAAQLKEFVSDYKNDAIESAVVRFWFNNHPNTNFFGGHTCIFVFKIKDNKVESVVNVLEG